MIKYVEYIVTWLFFMAIIVGLCLITPKIAKRIDRWRESRRPQNRESDVLSPAVKEQPADQTAEQPESNQPPETKE